MRKYEIFRMFKKQNGSFTVEASNLYHAVITARKWEEEDWEASVANGEYHDFPDFFEVWEVGTDGMYTSVRRYVFPA